MRSIEEIERLGEAMSLDELQAEKTKRDEVVAQMRAECGRIHALMEPKWEREQKLAASPVHLKQMIGGDDRG